MPHGPLATLVECLGTEDKHDELLKLIVESLPGATPKEKPQVIEAMRQRILCTFDGQAPRVLDPSAGGGSLPLKHLVRLRAYAQDLNPNAGC